jgi:hypothetical protein
MLKAQKTLRLVGTEKKCEKPHSSSSRLQGPTICATLHAEHTDKLKQQLEGRTDKHVYL